MCLAIPGQVVKIESTPREDESTLLMGTVDFSGIRKPVCLDWVPDVKVGEYSYRPCRVCDQQSRRRRGA